VGLIKTVAFVLALGLSLIGIQAKNKMWGYYGSRKI
jgi:arginyl-tRNA synthetase